MNTIADTLGFIKDLAGDTATTIAKLLYNITGLEDPLLLSIVATIILIAPINYLLVDKFTRNFSWIKITFLVPMLPALYFLLGLHEYKDFMKELEVVSKGMGITGVFFTLFTSISLILEDPYYNGLFGRFRDN